jgi:hypothetical protein
MTRRIYFIFDPVLWLTLAFVGFLIYCPGKFLLKRPGLLFVHSVCQETMHGHLEGQHTGYPNPVNFSSEVEPGDIILCHNRGGGYGFWTHSAIYIGKNQAVDSEDFANGTQIVNVNKYRNYDEVAIFRGRVSESIRKRIAKSALNEVGKPYDPFSSIEDSHSEYCSKLIWRVYRANGISICAPKSWIVPDDIAGSKNVTMMLIWNAAQDEER